MLRDRNLRSTPPPLSVSPGAGSAKLSFVLLQKLLKLSEYLPRRRESGSGAAGGADGANGAGGNDSGGGGGGGGGFCFKYVITDFSHANFGFWMNHPRLQELFALGIVDFAVFDAEAGPGEIGGEKRPGAEGDAAADSNDSRSSSSGGRGGGGGGGDGGPGVGLWGSGCLRLELSGEELRPGDLDNPVIVVANYVFDSLKQDAFRYIGAFESAVYVAVFCLLLFTFAECCGVGKARLFCFFGSQYYTFGNIQCSRECHWSNAAGVQGTNYRLDHTKHDKLQVPPWGPHPPQRV